MNQQSNVQYLPVGKEQQEYEIVSNLILQGDLSRLHPLQKIEYYKSICERIGLDPMTQPFKLIYFPKSGKEELYCSRSGAQQLNKLHRVSHRITSREIVHDCYTVVARASLPNGRKTESLGAVTIAGIKGEKLAGDNFANALMKAETKAKRRATLDLLGLGVLDESELETIPDAQTAPVIVTPAPEAIEDKTPKIHPEDLMTEKQKGLILKLVKSSLFSEDEKQKAAEFLSRPKKKKSASKFIDRLLELKKEREENKKISITCRECAAEIVIEKNLAGSKGWQAFFDSDSEIFWKCPGCKSKPFERREPEGTPKTLRKQARALKQAAEYADDPAARRRDVSRAEFLLKIADRREKELSEPMSERDAEELKRNCIRHGITGNDKNVLFDFVEQAAGLKKDSIGFFNELNEHFRKYAKEAGLLP